MKQRQYLKTYNSQSTLDQLWDQLSAKQQIKLQKLLAQLDQNLSKFKDQEDIAYSLLLHCLQNKISLEETEVTVTKLTAKHNTPFDKFQPVEPINGEIKW